MLKGKDAPNTIIIDFVETKSCKKKTNSKVIADC